jgi:hypothetical protein
MTNAQFYLALGVPLVGILVNVVLFQTLNHRIDRLADRHSHLDVRLQNRRDLLVAKLDEVAARLARMGRKAGTL